ncbi:MAG: HU family DNA-binding protein [Paenirhodobacter sp.]|uniref:HU family DNA-binding protein n=1 Tax=Paenirhodobacter sp. TaxID=1965326 RepID=UPI003D0B17DA
MKQKDLIRTISMNCVDAGYPMGQREIEVALNGLAGAVSKALAEGDDVTIPGIVKISTKRREAHIGRNPATGAAVNVPAKTVVLAKPVKALSDQIA